MSAQTSIGANDGRIQSPITSGDTASKSIDFPFFSKDDVVITITESNGTIHTYTRGVDYNITATVNDDGIYPSGTVAFLGGGAPVSGTLTRYRLTGISRVSQLPLTGFLSRVSLNADLNRVMCAMQDFDRKAVNALRFSEEDAIASAIVLPQIVNLKGKVLAFDATTGAPVASNLTLSQLETYADTSVAAAAASAAAAAASASAASSSASSASSSAAAAALTVSNLTGTSTTSLTPALSSKVFTTQSGKSWSVGTRLRATSDSNSAVWMEGVVTDYTTTTLTMTPDVIGTATAKADWTIRITGAQGATGATGPAGPGGASISDDTTTAATEYPLFSSVTTGNPATIYVSTTKLNYKPSTGEFTMSVPVAGNGIMVNSQTVSVSYTIAAGYSGVSAGPISIASGKSVTVASGSKWVVL